MEASQKVGDLVHGKAKRGTSKDDSDKAKARKAKHFADKAAVEKVRVKKMYDDSDKMHKDSLDGNKAFDAKMEAARLKQLKEAPSRARVRKEEQDKLDAAAKAKRKEIADGEPSAPEAPEKQPEEQPKEEKEKED